MAVMGNSNAGKDTAAIWIDRHTCLRYPGSLSAIACPFMSRVLGKSCYDTWRDRHKDRELWYSTLNALSKSTNGILCRLALEEGNVVVGAREKNDVDIILDKDRCDLVVWIDCDLSVEDYRVSQYRKNADVIIVNDMTSNLIEKISSLLKFAGIYPSNCDKCEGKPPESCKFQFEVPRYDWNFIKNLCDIDEEAYLEILSNAWGDR